MRFGSRNGFDLTDVEDPIDCVDQILDVAGDVLRDYGNECGQTRIERMARWIALNLGGPPYESKRAGGLEKIILGTGDHDLAVLRAGHFFGIEQDGVTIIVGRSALEARSLAVALMRCAEHAEE